MNLNTESCFVVVRFRLTYNSLARYIFYTFLTVIYAAFMIILH